MSTANPDSQSGFFCTLTTLCSMILLVKALTTHSPIMIAYVVALLMVFAGILHFTATPERLTAGTLLGVFFMVLGIIQITYAYLLTRARTRPLLLFGILFNTGLLVLWLLTQTLPHLAGSSREPLTVLSGLRKALELISVELLLSLLRHQTPKT